jgi:hypothetical protein
MSIQRMVCTGCGAEANASCNCGLNYVPAAVRVAEAIKANPGKSIRLIAAEIGVSKSTVGRAYNSTVPSGTVEEKRIGADGRTRRMPSRKPQEPPDKEELDSYHALFLMRADTAIRCAEYVEGTVITDKMIAAARRVAAEWTTLTEQMENMPCDASASPETVTGLDGKQCPVKRRDDDRITPKMKREAALTVWGRNFLRRAADAERSIEHFAEFKRAKGIKIDDGILAALDNVVAAWTALRDEVLLVERRARPPSDRQPHTP